MPMMDTLSIAYSFLFNFIQFSQSFLTQVKRVITPCFLLRTPLRPGPPDGALLLQPPGHHRDLDSGTELAALIRDLVSSDFYRCQRRRSISDVFHLLVQKPLGQGRSITHMLTNR